MNATATRTGARRLEVARDVGRASTTTPPILRLVISPAGTPTGLAPAVRSAATVSWLLQDDGEAARPHAPHDNHCLESAIEEVAGALGSSPLDLVSPEAMRDRVALIERLTGLAAAGMAATLAGLRRAGGIDADGAGSTAEWVKANTSRSGRDAARVGRLADNIDELPATADALASGRMTPEAADALVRAARDGRMGGPDQVEHDLLAIATSGPPEQLRADIRRRQQRVDATAMLRDERKQHGARRASLVRRDSGMWDLHACLPDEIGQMAATALDAFDQSDPDGVPLLQQRRPGQRRADALAALLATVLDRGLAPGTGGIVRPHISVIVPASTFSTDLDDSTEDPPAPQDPRWSDLPPGQLEWGGHLSPQATRRLCCDAAVSRIVMTADSQVLDVGRATRNCRSRNSGTSNGPGNSRGQGILDRLDRGHR